MKKSNCRTRLGGIGFGMLGVCCMILLLFYTDSAVAAVRQGLLLCRDTVIPALFPFMVASEILVGCGGAAAIGNVFSRPVKRILGMPGAAACPVVLGALCGFPTGARAAAALYDTGVLSARQCTRLLTFINNPSSAYMISAVGASLLGSRRLGLLLWGVSLLCSLGTALVTRVLMPDDSDGTAPAPRPVRMGAEVFTSAVSTAAQSMLAVCAYVLFFSAVLGALQSALAHLALPPAVSALLYGIVEMSGGIARAAEVANTAQAAMLCAGISCWSGLSVMCQIMTVCHGRGFAFLPYLLAKAAQALTAAALTGLAVRFLLPLLPPEDMHASLLIPEGTAQVFIKTANIAFVIACAAMMWKKAKRACTGKIYDATIQTDMSS
jgi:sporulation integral membrane protein YlbJ